MPATYRSPVLEQQPPFVVATLIATDGQRGSVAMPEGIVSVIVAQQAGTAALTAGARVLVLRAPAQGMAPIVLGTVELAAEPPATLVLQAARIELVATHAIELVCGESSLALRAPGDADLRARRIRSRARGAHFVQGGSVHVN